MFFLGIEGTIIFFAVGEKSVNLPGAEKMLQFFPTRRADPIVVIGHLDDGVTYQGKPIPKQIPNQANFAQGILAKEVIAIWSYMFVFSSRSRRGNFCHRQNGPFDSWSTDGALISWDNPDDSPQFQLWLFPAKLPSSLRADRLEHRCHSDWRSLPTGTLAILPIFFRWSN